jgi:hypothetical protein
MRLAHQFGPVVNRRLGAGFECSRLPAKRLRSTWVSAAMITRSAAAMSSAVRVFCAPTEPWVSTLMAWP